MGGGGSKTKTSILREIDSKLDAQFTANCNSNAQIIQEINLDGLNIIARDNCRISFMNKASVNSTCDMGPIIDAISEMAVSTDREFAKGLQEAQDQQANQKCEADNCEDKLKVAVTKRLTSACESSAKAQQTLKIIGLTILCDGNAVANFGNSSEVRATCLRSLLHSGVEDASSEGAENTSSASTSSLPYLDNDIKLMVIMGVFALFLVVILTKK